MASETTATAHPRIAEISREELLRRLHDPSLTILDVLPESSYAEAHIPGAVNIPLEQLSERAAGDLPHNRAAEIAVYCGKFT